MEIHLSYKDLEVNLDQVLPTKQQIGVVVHAPELFAGDHTLDLCSADHDYRRHSIEELQRVVEISRDLRRRFECPDPVLLVTNVEGFLRTPPSRARGLASAASTPDRQPEADQHRWRSGDHSPDHAPFPWHFGGQRYHNLFVDSDFIQGAVKKPACASAWMYPNLACTHLHASFGGFLGAILPFTAHLHLADAKGVDGEDRIQRVKSSSSCLP